MAIALRYLDVSEMLALSSSWLGAERPTLTRAPELAALLPRLDEAHQSLARSQAPAQQAPGEHDQKLAAEARSIDDRHDHAVRALYYAVAAALSYHLASEDPDLDAIGRLEALRDMILPEGLATTQASYDVEAATAARAAEAVASDPEAQQLLRDLRLLPRVSGLDLLKLWAELGTRLGALELKKSSGDTSATRARNAWLGVVASMLSVLPVVRDEGAARAVREPLQRASNEAARRYTQDRRKK